jgi:hypothetical protein
MILFHAVAAELVAVMSIWQPKRVSLIVAMGFAGISTIRITPVSFTNTGRIFAVSIDNISCITETDVHGKNLSN